MSIKLLTNNNNNNPGGWKMKRAVPLNFWGKMFLKLDRISASIEAHNLIPQTCEYITLYYKNDVAGVLKFMDLEMG